MWKKFKKILSFMLVLLLSLTGINMPSSSFALGNDVTSALVASISEKKITQNGAVISPGSTFDAKQNISVDFKFRAKYKDPAEVKKGDFATIKISKDLVAKDTQAIPLTTKIGTTVTHVGTARFKNVTINGENWAVLEVVFDGDASVFTHDYSDFNVKGLFGVNLTQIEFDSGVTKDVDIMGNAYIAKANPVEQTIEIKKSGTPPTGKDRFVKWKVEVNAKRGTSNGDLTGYTFEDALAQVGDYRTGTFKVDGVSKSPTYGTSKILTYTLDSTLADKSKAIIEFETDIPSRLWFKSNANADPIINNTATLKKGTLTKSATTSVKVPAQMITKTFDNTKKYYTSSNNTNNIGIYTDGSAFYIDWIVEFNPNEYDLGDVVLRDYLQKRDDTIVQKELVVKPGSAKLQYWNGSTWVDNDSSTGSILTELPGGSLGTSNNLFGKYSDFKITNVNKKMKLIFTTRVNDSDYAGLAAVPQTVYTNQVNLSFKENLVNTTTNASARSVLNFGGKLGKYINNLRTVPPTGTNLRPYSPTYTSWRITVSSQNVLDNNDDGSWYVYDYIIYDPSINNLSMLTESNGMNFDRNSLSNRALANKSLDEIFNITKPSTLINHRYIETTYKHPKVDVKPIPLYKNGVEVGHILELHYNKGIMDSPKPWPIVQTNITTELTDPNQILHDNSTAHGKSTFNAAKLFRNESLVAQFVNSARHNSYVLEKRAMSKEKAIDFINNPTAENANQNLTDEKTALTNNAFNYNDNSVLYRLSINKNNHTGLKMIVEDQLPDGWEFMEIKDGEEFLLFNGEVVTTDFTNYDGSTMTDSELTNPIEKNSIVKAIGNPITPSNFSANNVNGKYTFTFDKIDRPYVILLRAKPKDSTLINYVNTTKYPENTATIKVDGFDPQVTKTQTVEIKSIVTGKTGEEVIESTGDHAFKWTVNYTPSNFIKGTKVLLKDKLVNLEPRLMSDGSLNPEYYEVFANGQKVSGNDLDGLLTFNTATSELIMKIPNPIIEYKFTYITDPKVNIAYQQSVNNSVSLFINDPTDPSSEAEKAGDDKTATVQSSNDITVTTIPRNWFEIVKIDADDGDNLEGVKFQLTDESDTTKKTIKETAFNGKIRFDRIPDGTYELEEIGPKTGYLDNDIKYQVVAHLGSVTITAKDGSQVSFDDPDNKIIKITNKKVAAMSNLTITKIVAGTTDPVELAKVFKFNVEIGSDPNAQYESSKDGGQTIVRIPATSTVELAHGEHIEIIIPDGTYYEVTEDPVSSAGYTVTNTGISSGILNGDMDVVFTNTKDAQQPPPPPPTPIPTDTLRVKKTVIGTPPYNQAFDFTVSFDFSDVISLTTPTVLNIKKTHSDTSITNDTLNLTDSTVPLNYMFNLKHGDYIDFSDLPIGTKYKLTETDYADFTEDAPKDGTIISQNPLVEFVNRYIAPVQPPVTSPVQLYNLTLEKQVDGNAGDFNKLFNFNITIGTDSTKSYNYTRNDGSTGSLGQTTTIGLKHGDSIKISIPEGTTYSISEDSYATENYTTTHTANDVGTVNSDINVTFKNTRNITPPTNPGGGGGGGGTTPTNPTTPTIPTTPADPTTPTTPSNPADPTTPDTPSNPTTPSTPTTPTIPANPDTPNNNTPPRDNTTVVWVVDENNNILGKALMNNDDNSYVFINDDSVPMSRAMIKDGNKLEIIEETPVPKSTQKLPKTGQENNYLIYVSGLALLLLGLKKFKKSNKK